MNITYTPFELLNNSPMLKEEIVKINDYFSCFYNYFKNPSEMDFSSNFWFTFKKWKELSFVAPVSNPLITGPRDAGVVFGCCEHASVCINGHAEYIMTTPTGTDSINWEFGMHNVENGYGYLLKEPFKTVFHNDFISCCAAQNPDVPRDKVYKFDILNNSTAVSKNYEWIHVAYGSIELEETTYNQKQTMYNVAAGSQLNMTGQAIAIACYTD